MIEVYIRNCLLLDAFFTDVDCLDKTWNSEYIKKRHSNEMPPFILFTKNTSDTRYFVDATLMSSSLERSVEECLYHLRSFFRRNYSSR